MTVVGVLLAGGRSRRMGGEDKALLPFGGKPLIAHVAERFLPQVDRLVVNANGDPARFGFLHLPVVADADDSYAGPLAGILSGMDWAAANVSGAAWIATVAADMPFIPPDLVSRLLSASTDPAIIRIAATAGRRHQVTALWPVALRPVLASWLRQDNSRAVVDWIASQQSVAVPFEMEGGRDPFFNINTPDDLERARALAAPG